MVLKSQISLTDLWVLNGEHLAIQVQMINEPFFGEFLDFHTLLLQVEATLLPPDHFLLHLATKFELDYWFSFKNRIESATDVVEQNRIMGMQTAIADDMLQLLLEVVIEQSLISGKSNETAVEREMIHKLAVAKGGLSYSKLQVNSIFVFTL
jgi:hypothetical protein